MPAPSERTPLIVEHAPDADSDVHEELPSLSAALATLATNQRPLNVEHVTDLLASFSLDPSRQYAFFFAVVLYLEARVVADKTSTLSQVNSVARTTRAVCTELWTNYVEVALVELEDEEDAEQAVMEMLWMPVRVSDEGDEDADEANTSVAELLDILPRTSVLLEQPAISTAIEAAWKYGHPQPRPAPTLTPRPSSHLRRLFTRLSRPVSPRVSHLLDAIVYTTYIACEAHVVITGLRDDFGRQDIWILIYSSYALLPFPLPPRPRPSLRRKKYFVPRRVGFLFALLAYLPLRFWGWKWERPKPETLPHLWLLLSVGWNTMRLILSPAMRPGWILLFPPRVSLVPALEFNRFMKPVVLRPIIYFIPLILLYGLMLSLSMDDPWTVKSLLSSSPSSSSLATIAKEVGAKTFPIFQPIIPAPYDTREAFFLFLLLTVAFWFFFALASLIRVAASMNLVTYPNSRPGMGLAGVGSPAGGMGARSPSFVVSPLAHSRRPTATSSHSFSGSPDLAPPAAPPSGEDGTDVEPLSSDAVRILLHNIGLYQGWHFPAPVSVLPFLVVSVPGYVLDFVGYVLARRGSESSSASDESPARDGSQSADRSRSTERSGERNGSRLKKAKRLIKNLDGILWWVLIWPVSFLLAGFWGWGYRGRRYAAEGGRRGRGAGRV